MPGDMETEILLENRELFEKRPDCWEFILTVDRLERPLEELICEVDDLVPVPASPRSSALASAELLRENIAAVGAALEALCPLMEARLAESWGAPGQPGAVADIERVCGEIFSCCKEIADAERAILTASMHPQLIEARNKFQGLASENLSRLLKVIKPIRNFLAAGSTGDLNLRVHFTTERLAGIDIPDMSGGLQPAMAKTPDRRGMKVCNLLGGTFCLVAGLISLCGAWPMGLLLLFLALWNFAYAFDSDES